MTHEEIINLLTGVLLDCRMDAAVAAAIGETIEYLQSGFFNEDASREIDRLTVELESKEKAPDPLAWVDQFTLTEEELDEAIARMEKEKAPVATEAEGFRSDP